MLTEHPVPGVPVHLTGLSGAYCPELDPITAAVVLALKKLIDVGREVVDLGELATLAFGGDSPKSRRKIREARLGEIAYHARVIVEKTTEPLSLRNGGVGQRNGIQFIHRPS